jgi:ArsR family transcriptional regulator, arsenate/arsenite/antimonite-responsive transcriptional repressor
LTANLLFRYLPKYISIQQMNNLFKAFNDPTRREILELLKNGDMTAGDIADHFEMSKPSISHHLDLLKQADLVVAVKQGQFITYSLNMTVMDEILAWFVQFKTSVQKEEIIVPKIEKPRIRLQINKS